MKRHLIVWRCCNHAKTWDHHRITWDHHRITSLSVHLVTVNIWHFCVRVHLNNHYRKALDRSANESVCRSVVFSSAAIDTVLSPTQYRWCPRHSETQWEEADQRERPRSAVTGDCLGATLRGNTTGAPAPVKRGQVSLTDHYSLRPQLLTAGSSHLDSLLPRQDGSRVLPTRGLHSQWAPGMCWSERWSSEEAVGWGKPSGFRERRHNDGDISFPALRRSMSFHQHLYFILSSLGKLRLGLRHKHKPQISRRWMMSSHAAYIHTQNIKCDL